MQIHGQSSTKTRVPLCPLGNAELAMHVHVFGKDVITKTHS